MFINIIEQDHRFIKKITRSIRGFKTFATEPAVVSVNDKQ